MSSKPSIAWPRKQGYQCRVQENLLGALADPDLVDVAIEPGSVTDAAGGSFRVAACFLRMRCISCAWHFTAVALADTGRRLEN